jgi:hypothetical protein
MSTESKKAKRFRVLLEQINQTYMDVQACGPDEACAKALAKWRREEAWPAVLDCKEIDSKGERR